MEMINNIISERYLLIKLLGKGGYSSIYLAKDTRVERNVVIKIFEKQKDLSPVRIQKKANILASLKHPNIVLLLDVGHYANFYYQVM